ncbi:MAG: transcription antitermination factor NusB [Chloroflexota bacterium]
MSNTPELIPENEEDDQVYDERSIARRIALQALYEIDLAHHPVGEVLTIHLQTQQPSRKIVRYVQDLVHGVVDTRPVLDEAIKLYAPEFPLEQIAVIDRNILRIAIFEFAVRARTPVGVAIDEAVELAKMFGADGASSFINGVLGAVADDEQWLRKVRQVESDQDDDPT